MPESVDKEALKTIADNIINRDDQVRIATLNDELTISQVVKFFEKQGKSFTKTMIQNYIRIGVLPPPVDKRYYTRNHLILLTLIDSLKAIYSLEDIKTVLAPIRNNPDIFEDDIVKPTDVYKNYLAMRKQIMAKWKESLPQLFDQVDTVLNEDGIKKEEKKIAAPFMITLAIMTETIVMRDLVNEIKKEYMKEV